MKGLLFTDFGEFVAQELPGAAGVLGGEAYDPLGTYTDQELLRLVSRASKAAGVPVAEILKRFGAHLFRTLVTLYPVFLDGVDDALELLSGIETYVHGEVKKLYPDAEFPRFDVRRRSTRLDLTYRSSRPLADLAEGMIRGCVAWFGDRLEVERADLDGADGHAAQFILRTARGRATGRRAGAERGSSI